MKKQTAITLLLNQKRCTGCMACADICAKKAITLNVDVDGHIYPSLNASLCVSCGLCISTCPALKAVSHQKPISSSFASWSQDSESRLNSASGAVFFAMANYFVTHGGYVCGAVLDGVRVKHIVSNKIEDVVKMQGSKYQQGETIGVYREVKDLLSKGNMVLFCGTPCQVAAVKSVVGDRLCEQLTTIDFICGGFPSQLPLRRFIQNCGFDVKRIVSYRDKDDGWKSVGYKYNLKVEDTSGLIYSYGMNNIVSLAFASHITNRSSCLSCDFSVLKNSFADFTVGDYWGCKLYKEEESKGISIVMVHNPDKKYLLNESNICHYPIQTKDFVSANARSFIGTFYGYSISLFRLIYPRLLQKANYSFLCSCFGVSGYQSLLGKGVNVSFKLHKKLDQIIKRNILKTI